MVRIFPVLIFPKPPPGIYRFLFSVPGLSFSHVVPYLKSNLAGVPSPVVHRDKLAGLDPFGAKQRKGGEGCKPQRQAVGWLHVGLRLLLPRRMPAWFEGPLLDGGLIGRYRRHHAQVEALQVQLNWLEIT